MTDSTHAKLAPSAAHRWMNCPSSIALSKGIPDTETPAAAEGTFAHDIAAICLERGVDAIKLEGRSDGVHHVDADMAENIQVYLDAVRAVGLIFGVDVIRTLVEQRVRLAGLFDQIHGTADAIVFSDRGRRMDVFDLKFGSGVYVDVAGNPQLKIYGLGALLTYPKIAERCDVVGLHVVQPRHRVGPAWRHVELDATELVLWGCELQVAAQRAAQAGPGDNLAAGAWCKFCPAKTRCPALRDHATQTAADVFEDVTEDLTPARTPPDAKALTPAKLGEILRAFPLVEDWMKAVRAEAYERANSGQIVPGFKLVQKTGHRKWRNDDAAAAEIEALGGDPWEPRKVVSPAEAERRVGKANKKKVAEFAFKPLAGTALVPDDDKREAVTPGSVFDEISTGPE